MILGSLLSGGGGVFWFSEKEVEVKKLFKFSLQVNAMSINI